MDIVRISSVSTVHFSLLSSFSHFGKHNTLMLNEGSSDIPMQCRAKIALKNCLQLLTLFWIFDKTREGLTANYEA